MTYFTRRQIIEILNIDESFLLALEQEEILSSDGPPEQPSGYSDRMLERVRVADNLVHELEVNLAGVAVIVQMREEVATLREQLADLAREALTAAKARR